MKKCPGLHCGILLACHGFLSGGLTACSVGSTWSNREDLVHQTFIPLQDTPNLTPAQQKTRKARLRKDYAKEVEYLELERKKTQHTYGLKKS